MIPRLYQEATAKARESRAAWKSRDTGETWGRYQYDVGRTVVLGELLGRSPDDVHADILDQTDTT